MEVGDRVRFIGPMYETLVTPQIGQMGTVREMKGYQARIFGKDPVELVTVFFDDDFLPTVLDRNRLERVSESK